MCFCAFFVCAFVHRFCVFLYNVFVRFCASFFCIFAHRFCLLLCVFVYRFYVLLCFVFVFWCVTFCAAFSCVFVHRFLCFFIHSFCVFLCTNKQNVWFLRMVFAQTAVPPSTMHVCPQLVGSSCSAFEVGEVPPPPTVVLRRGLCFVRIPRTARLLVVRDLCRLLHRDLFGLLFLSLRFLLRGLSFFPLARAISSLSFARHLLRPPRPAALLSFPSSNFFRDCRL